MVGVRHASKEITAKLAHAKELAAKGKTQREISQALGISLMTYHRWKKSLKATEGSVDSNGHGKLEVRPQRSNAIGSDEMIKHLELENTLLRRHIADMLLDKLMLEEEIRARQAAQIRPLSL
jgi:hypothetical protein